MVELEQTDSGKLPAHEKIPTGKRVVILVGPEGSGKTTQARLLSERLHLPIFGMGEAFRSLQDSPTRLGEEIRDMILNHKYSTPDMYWEVFANRLKQGDLREGFIADGALRQKWEIEGFKARLGEHIKDAQVTVVYLRIPVWQGAERLLGRGREGFDTKEDALNRLRLFYKQLGVKMSVVRKNFNFIQVSAFGKTEQELHNEILKKIGGS